MYKFIRNVDEIAEWAKSLPCTPGAPLAMLDFYGGAGIETISGGYCPSYWVSAPQSFAQCVTTATRITLWRISG